MQTQSFETHLSPSEYPNIPIRNIWLLMAYAADLPKDFLSKKTATQDFEENLMDTVAELLCTETKRQLKFGLSVGYESVSEELSRLRGKVDHLRSASSNSFLRGKIFCNYEKLNYNTVENQIVRLSLYRISRYVENPDIAFTCRALNDHLSGLGVGLFSGNTGSYLLGEVDHRRRNSHLLALAILALRMDLVSEETGKGNYLSPNKQESWIRSLYEKAIGGFYRHHLVSTDWIVNTGCKHTFFRTDSSPGLSRILPNMKTDIEITNHSSKEKLIIDTKFTKIVKPGRFGDFRLSSSHIYQMYTYLRTGEEADFLHFDSINGLLLYPAYGQSLYEETLIQGHKFVFATVNLLAEPSEIKSQLLNLLDRISAPLVNS